MTLQSIGKAVAHDLDSLGARTIAARCDDDGVFYTDSGELIIARLSGQRFGVYTRNTPNRRAGPKGEPAKALYTYFKAFVRRYTPKTPTRGG